MPLILRLWPLLLLLACRNDFSLQAELQDTPVVFGYLDAAEAVHYVRVERVVGTAGAGAADPGQLYYDPEDATVRMTNLATQVTTEMERVDGGALGLPREAGPFATTPNILYRVNDSAVKLRPGQEVEVSVQRPGGEADARATTRMLEAIRILRPAATARIDDYRRPLIIAWNAPPEATVFAVQLLFAVRESYAADPSRDRTIQLTYDINLAYQPSGGDRTGELVNLPVDNEAIYRFLGQSLEPGTGMTRRLSEFDVRVAAAGPEVATLLALADANAGLTGAQPRPRYTNVAGGEGLLTSRSTDRRSGIQLDPGSLDSLREGRYTRDLNFR